MSEGSIKYHPISNTYIIQKKSYFQETIVTKGNLIVGSGCSFWKNLEINGNLELGKNTLVKGNIKANNILIASHCEIQGNIDSKNDIIIMNGVKIKGSSICNGNMQVRSGCSLNFAKAGNTLELIGKVNIKDIEITTKVIVRSE